MAAVELEDVQALVRSGFGSLGAARYILLRFRDARRAKAWLGAASPTRAAQVGSDNDLFEVMQVAFTAAGLSAAGFTDAELETLAPEFLDGMASDERRSQRLGDIDESAPAHWAWGRGETEPHMLVILMAKRDRIAEWTSTVEDQLGDNGFSIVAAFDSSPEREDGEASREPFGFADGLSQPEPDWDDLPDPVRARSDGYRRIIAPGEVLLGYTNEHGAIAGDDGGPLVQRNGSYLVYRQLKQDVAGFWQWLALVAGPTGAQALAERMMGRRMDGASLAGTATSDRSDDFVFDHDPDGIACPIGAHIRRANPRSGDEPPGRRGFPTNFLASLGLIGSPQDDAVASARYHRILRRGRAYGASSTIEEALSGSAAPIEAGLHFICLNTSLARQFEFVQAAWLMNPAFGGLSQERDPVIGHRAHIAGNRRADVFRFHDDQQLPRISQGIPRFVEVRGGAYFFLPGLAGLRSIARR